MNLTFISDTHGKHNQLSDLPGGDILIHSGDISDSGELAEIKAFLHWFDSIDGYTHKIFIAGNHDFLFENNPQAAELLVSEYEDIVYLFDNSIEVDNLDNGNKIKIYGSPWQPWFYNWAFNLPRGGEKIEEKWKAIPDDVDILITHGPPKRILDLNKRDNFHCGCEKLERIIWSKSPKLHVFGHIHEGYGWMARMETHFFNASVLDEHYNLTNDPFNIEWDYDMNKVTFL